MTLQINLILPKDQAMIQRELLSLPSNEAVDLPAITSFNPSPLHQFNHQACIGHPPTQGLYLKRAGSIQNIDVEIYMLTLRYIRRRLIVSSIPLTDRFAFQCYRRLLLLTRHHIFPLLVYINPIITKDPLTPGLYMDELKVSKIESSACKVNVQYSKR